MSHEDKGKCVRKGEKKLTEKKRGREREEKGWQDPKTFSKHFVFQPGNIGNPHFEK